MKEMVVEGGREAEVNQLFEGGNVSCLDDKASQIAGFDKGAT